MKFGRTGLAVLGLFAVAAVGCPQPSHKTFNDAGDETGGDGGDGGEGGKATGGKTGSGGSGSGGSGSGGSGSGGSGSGGSGSGGSGSGGSGSGGSGSGGSGSGGSGGMAGMAGGTDGGAGAGGMGGATGATMAGWMTLYDTLIRPKCGPGCHITGTNGGLGMANAMAAYTNLINKPASNATCKMMRVIPGDAANSVFYKKLAGATCGTRMPAGAGKMPFTAAELKMVEDWIKGP